MNQPPTKTLKPWTRITDLDQLELGREYYITWFSDTWQKKKNTIAEFTGELNGDQVKFEHSDLPWENLQDLEVYTAPINPNREVPQHQQSSVDLDKATINLARKPKPKTDYPNAKIMWNRARLIQGLKNGAVIGIAESGLTIKFVLDEGSRSGYLVSANGTIRRFQSESDAWSVIESIKLAAVPWS